MNSTLQSELSPCDIKACHYLGKPQQSSVIAKFVYFAQRNFIWQSRKSVKGIVNKTGYPVYLTERLPPKCRKLQFEAKQMGVKTVTNNCELQVVCPRTEGGVNLRPTHTKAELLKLTDAALPLSKITTVDNRRPGKRNKGGSTGVSPEKKLRIHKKILWSTWSMHKA